MFYHEIPRTCGITKLMLAAVLCLYIPAQAQIPTHLKTTICPISPDSTFPGFAMELSPIVNSATAQCGIQLIHDSRDWFFNYDWYAGRPLEKPRDKGEVESAVDTLPNTDVWGRTYFKVSEKGTGGHITAWRMRTANRMVWTLRILQRDTSPVRPQSVPFELLSNDKTVFMDTAVAGYYEPFYAAWVYGDTCVVIYQSDHGYITLINGNPLPYDDTWGYTYLKERPFFFFRQDDLWGWSYNGRESAERFDRMHYHACCEPAMWNEVISLDGFRIFAHRDNFWYIVQAQIEEE